MTTRRFTDLKINKGQSSAFQGEKISIHALFDREITIHAYRISPARFNTERTDKYLQMQISIDDQKRVVFTTSKVMMDIIEQIPSQDFPFVTTLIKKDQRYEFT